MQALAGNLEGEHAASGLGDGTGDGVLGALLDHQQDAAASAGPADFGGAAAALSGDGDQFVDQRRGDSGGIGTAQLPLLAEQAGHVFPIVTQKGLMHVAGDGDDLLEVAEDVFCRR